MFGISCQHYKKNNGFQKKIKIFAGYLWKIRRSDVSTSQQVSAIPFKKALHRRQMQHMTHPAYASVSRPCHSAVKRRVLNTLSLNQVAFVFVCKQQKGVEEMVHDFRSGARQGRRVSTSSLGMLIFWTLFSGTFSWISTAMLWGSLSCTEKPRVGALVASSS